MNTSTIYQFQMLCLLHGQNMISRGDAIILAEAIATTLRQE